MRATFKDYNDLFRLAMGKPLKDLIANTKVQEGVEALFKFRNGVAHARPETFVKYDDDEETLCEVEGQYKELNAYLAKNRIVLNPERAFENAVVDHFAALVKPYIHAVTLILPKENVGRINGEVRFAFGDILKLQASYLNERVLKK